MANKLVKICRGLYRTPNGNVSISHRPFPALMERDSEVKLRPWLVRHATVYGTEINERFRTLSEARESLR